MAKYDKRVYAGSRAEANNRQIKSYAFHHLMKTDPVLLCNRNQLERNVRTNRKRITFSALDRKVGRPPWTSTSCTSSVRSHANNTYIVPSTTTLRPTLPRSVGRLVTIAGSIVADTGVLQQSGRPEGHTDRVRLAAAQSFRHRYDEEFTLRVRFVAQLLLLLL